MFFSETMNISVIVSEHFQKENKAFSVNVSVFTHQSCQSKGSLTAERLGENKRQPLFYTTPNTHPHSQAMGLLFEQRWKMNARLVALPVVWARGQPSQKPILLLL